MNKKIQIAKVIYRVFYKGKRYALPICVSTGAECREKVLVRRLPARADKKS